MRYDRHESDRSVGDLSTIGHPFNATAIEDRTLGHFRDDLQPGNTAAGLRAAIIALAQAGWHLGRRWREPTMTPSPTGHTVNFDRLFESRVERYEGKADIESLPISSGARAVSLRL